ncbi:hypothetical protein PLESTM_000901300 [Pleodorina starrii]|nr:hypothetical protein PLESTM_000901300 [Pleodorina starrii]
MASPRQIPASATSLLSTRSNWAGWGRGAARKKNCIEGTGEAPWIAMTVASVPFHSDPSCRKLPEPEADAHAASLIASCFAPMRVCPCTPYTPGPPSSPPQFPAAAANSGLASSCVDAAA